MLFRSDCRVASVDLLALVCLSLEFLTPVLNSTIQLEAVLLSYEKNRASDPSEAKQIPNERLKNGNLEGFFMTLPVVVTEYDCKITSCRTFSTENCLL